MKKPDSHLRFATYNVEWFASLFDANNRLIRDGSWSGRRDVTKKQQIKALGKVMRALDADFLMVIEAPDTNPPRDSATALEHFARSTGLRARKAVSGFQSDTQQEITALYDPEIFEIAHNPRGKVCDGSSGDPAPRFDSVYCQDVDADAKPEKHVFSKPPLELAITHKASDTQLRAIGVHAKSKAPHGAKNREEEVRISIANRRKQLAQCVWIRARVEQHLKAGDHLLVMGDLNDGPGLDEYEKLFGSSGVEIVMGDPANPQNLLVEPNAQTRLNPRDSAAPSTARFYQHHKKRFLNALLDYIMISPMLAASSDPDWEIWHPFDTSEIYKNKSLRRALLRASDHFPVTLDLKLATLGASKAS